MITTKDLRVTLGQVAPIRMTALDYKLAPIRLTSPATAYFTLTADHKVPALFTLSSNDSLDCATVGTGVMTTVLRGRAVQNNVGTPITVALVGDSSSAVNVTVTNNAHVIHFKPGVSTVLAVEIAIGAFTTGSLVVSAAGVGATVLQVGDAFSAKLVTAVVILEQNSYPGQYVVTVVAARLALLIPTGDDDPYFWDSWIIDPDGQQYPIIADSRFSVFRRNTVLN